MNRDDEKPAPTWTDDMPADTAGRLAGGTARGMTNRDYLSIERIAADNGITVADVEAAVAGGALAVEPVLGKRCALTSNVAAWLAAGKPRTGAAAPRPTPAITPTLASSSRPDDGRAEVFASAAEQLGLDADEVIGAREIAANRRSAAAAATYEPPAYSATSYEPPVDEAGVLANVADQLELDPHELATNNRTIAGRRRVPV